ncbi:hypothetical protein ABZT06_44435 [Streptomyces sp. NPDC005483]|uniref:hypothetical protein n=1 Tax=Streptomyces sp. NPDC005483 TaxID=3154882 RepID=UPI00339F2D3A
MARCQCGGTGCNCVIVAGENTEVTGAGSTPNPFVITAVTNCAEVRSCLSNGAGISYNSSTGAISLDLSEDAGNNAVIRPNGLYVPTGAATVTAGCGLLGDGSGGSPVRANTAAWPHSCGIAANGGGVYCDPVSGQLKTDPPFRARYREAAANDTVTARVVPSTETTIQTTTITMVNPDPCRPAFVIVHRAVDVSFNLPANGGAAAAGINGDDLAYMKNTGSSGITSWQSQSSVMHNAVIPAGGSLAINLNVTVGRGAGGARYNRIQTAMRAWLFSIPLSA